MTTSPSPSTTSASDAPSETRPPVVRRLAVAASVAVLTNVALALLLRTVTGHQRRLPPLQPGPVAVATLVGVLAGGLLYLPAAAPGPPARSGVRPCSWSSEPC
jgi:hypothetical protein